MAYPQTLMSVPARRYLATEKGSTLVSPRSASTRAQTLNVLATLDEIELAENVPRPLSRAQETPVRALAVGEVDERPVADNADDESEDAFYDKDPAPTAQSTEADICMSC